METGMKIKEQFFSEEEMYRMLKEFAESDHLPQTERAVDYAREKHAGQRRKPSVFSDEIVPYIVHPYIMACQAHALGIIDDTVLTAALLHDVCEDCGVAPAQLPFSDEVKDAVRLLTKTGEKSPENTKKYYGGIAENPAAAIVKVLDRCNNVSGMMLSFSKERIIEYIEETEQYVLPLIDHIKKNYPQYCDAVFVLEYHLLSVTESIKAALGRL